MIRIAPPERYSGGQGLCKAFIIDCSIHFEHSPDAFPTDRSKIAFMISHLTGGARAWDQDSLLCHSLKGFKDTLVRTFDPVTTSREKARELSGLKRGNRSICDYATHFRTLAAESGWNSTVLYDVFPKGLSTSIQDMLIPLDLPLDLDSLIALAQRTQPEPQRRDSHALHHSVGWNLDLRPGPTSTCSSERRVRAHAAWPSTTVSGRASASTEGRPVFLLRRV